MEKKELFQELVVKRFPLLDKALLEYSLAPELVWVGHFIAELESFVDNIEEYSELTGAYVPAVFERACVQYLDFANFFNVEFSNRMLMLEVLRRRAETWIAEKGSEPTDSMRLTAAYRDQLALLAGPGLGESSPGGSE